MWITFSIMWITLPIFYVLLLFSYTLGWKRLKIWNFPNDYVPSTQICIIVPARNEAANIQSCLQSILQQKYPKNLFEIIVVDDHSVDNTKKLAKSIQEENMCIIELNRVGTQGKKMAIATAIQQTNATLIVTTDADCIVPPDWLMALASFYEQHEVKFITGSVVFEPVNTLWQKIWALDFIGMMGITGASVAHNWSNMSNGANLAYERAAFMEVNGFEGIDQIASGDDLLLMEKIAKRYPKQTAFLKSRKAIVQTLPPANFNEFLQQRIRWTSKSVFYKDWKITTILGLVWLFNVSILFTFCLFLGGYPQSGMWICGQLLAKSVVDALFLWSCMDFFKEKSKLLWLFLPTQLFQIPYIAWVGFIGNLGLSYEWKSRKVK